jgi:hypothetical protein
VAGLVEHWVEWQGGVLPPLRIPPVDGAVGTAAAMAPVALGAVQVALVRIEATLDGGEAPTAVT